MGAFVFIDQPIFRCALQCFACRTFPWHCDRMPPHKRSYAHSILYHDPPGRRKEGEHFQDSEDGSGQPFCRCIILFSRLRKIWKPVFHVLRFVGLLALFISVSIFFLPGTGSDRRYLFPRSINEKYVIAWLIAIDLYIIAFLRLPMESGYLIPMIPFVILIFGKYLYSKAFTVLCIMLILSSFFFNISPVEREDAATASPVSFVFNQGEERLSVDVFDGPMISYESRRKNGMKFTSDLLHSFDTLRRKSLIVSGRWYNQLYLQRKDSTEFDIQIRDYIKQDSLLYFIGKGYDIYYLPKQDHFNQLMREVDINLFGAKNYIKEKG